MKSDTASELVFVYGTLRRGGSNAFRMDGAEFVGRGRVEGKLYAISWYPGLVLVRDSGWVTGEVYRVGPEQLRALDEFEGISANEIEGAEYRRVRVDVTLDGMPCDDTLHAIAYEWIGPVDESRQIPSGDWLDVERPRGAPVFSILGVAALVMPLFGNLFGVFHLGFPVSLTRTALFWSSDLVFLVFLVFGASALVCAARRRERFANLILLGWFGVVLCTISLLFRGLLIVLGG